MNRRAIERVLESLSRAELRAIALELTDWLGADAAARMLPDSPFERSAERPQLQLAAVDTGLASARLAHVRAVALAAVRAHGAEVPALSAALRSDAVDAAIAEGIRAAVRDAERAVRFDLRAGLELTDEVLDTLVRVAGAAEAFGSRWTPPRPSVDSLLASIAERVAGVALDETTFGMLVEVCRTASRVADASHPWALVESAASNSRNGGAARWICRLLEHGAARDAVVPLLEALAGASGADADLVVQTAEMHLDAGPSVFEVLVRTLRAHERLDEARFWVGEARLRHPDSEAWSRLEAALF